MDNLDLHTCHGSSKMLNFFLYLTILVQSQKIFFLQNQNFFAGIINFHHSKAQKRNFLVKKVKILVIGAIQSIKISLWTPCNIKKNILVDLSSFAVQSPIESCVPDFETGWGSKPWLGERLTFYYFDILRCWQQDLNIGESSWNLVSWPKHVSNQ